MHLMSGLALLILNIRFKTWQQIRGTAPGILYVVMFNGLFYVISHKMHPLPWEFNSKQMNRKTLTYYHLFIIMPLLILLFLANRPQSLLKKFTYVIKWTVGSSIIEFFGHKWHAISFYHNWKMRWSTLLYVQMYTFCQLFLVKPWVTLGLSFISTAYYYKRFILSSLRIKHFMY
ncbi:hypothetical protein [Salipaludibacillus daqingensis]|uniref:hypothetical protein n=1 Tax=Salipaludibacillus daqingensis TaxID=3041001 RepID=UPI002473F3D7|nr:hypothetical protein [Salipaludibacillus daqingensis]